MRPVLLLWLTALCLMLRREIKSPDRQNCTHRAPLSLLISDHCTRFADRIRARSQTEPCLHVKKVLKTTSMSTPSNFSLQRCKPVEENVQQELSPCICCLNHTPLPFVVRTYALIRLRCRFNTNLRT